MELISRPLVSVIMPAYNCEQYVKQAIECILNQTYTNWELITGDDGSKDNTKKLIDGFSDHRIRIIHNDNNQGYLKIWNKLIAHAKGDYITFLDADDLCALNRIELLVHALNSNPTIGAVGSNFKRINSKNEIIDESNFPLKHEEIKLGIPEHYYFIGSALMIRKNVYEQIGGYHPFFERMGAEDHYWVYLILEKFKMINIPQSLYMYRFNENSVSGNLANNPSKLNIPKILEHLIQQRKNTGTDDLEQGNINTINEMLQALNKPYINDASYYFYYIAKRRFYEGHKWLALRHLLAAIKKAPSNGKYYRDLFYFIRK